VSLRLPSWYYTTKVCNNHADSAAHAFGRENDPDWPVGGSLPHWRFRSVKLSVCVLDGTRVLFEAGGKVTCGDPQSTYDLRVPVTGLTFAAPGVYVIEALADGVAFAPRELRVIAKEPAPASLAALTPAAS
jgi:hypothetical protein